MAVKKKRITMTTPPGRFSYPKLDKADYGTKDYPKPAGEYSVQFILNAKDPATKAFLAKLDPYYQEALSKGRAEFDKLKVEQRKKLKSLTENPLFTELYDSETEKPTGEIKFKFSTPASYKDRDTEAVQKVNPPPMFSASGKPVKGVTPWGGTLGKVSFVFDEDGYFIPGTGSAGLKLRLAGTQILELVEGGQRDAKSLGFGSEDGYDDISERDVDSDDADQTDATTSDDDASDF
jgi:hypothetical protein